jgi:hypothetical protein
VAGQRERSPEKDRRKKKRPAVGRPQIADEPRHFPAGFVVLGGLGGFSVDDGKLLIGAQQADIG